MRTDQNDGEELIMVMMTIVMVTITLFMRSLDNNTTRSVCW